MPIWLTILLALPQIINFVKEIIAIWREWKKVPAAMSDLKDTLHAMKSAKDDDERAHLLRNLKEKLQAHKCAQ